MTAHRADLHRLLRAALPASCIHLGADCIEVQARDRSAARGLPVARRG
jgi:hypothetical protein